MEDPNREILSKLMKEFADISYIRPEDIPDIALYMDQVTTFMETKLEQCKRDPDDKILTKTMINNYTKNKLIPPPDKKKYSKDHLFLLLYVYYLKDFLSISDIKSILGPLEDKHFNTGSSLSMQDIYKEVFELANSQSGYMTSDLLRRYKTACESFPEAEGEDAEYLHLFSYVCLLSFDVYVKKRMIESIAEKMDRFTDKTPPKKK